MVDKYVDDDPVDSNPVCEYAALRIEELEAQCDTLSKALRVLLAWGDRFLIDDKHLIGSICKGADDVQFRLTLGNAHAAIARVEGGER